MSFCEIMLGMKELKHVLVSGCAGFIGSRFCHIMRERHPHAHIVGIDNFFNSSRERVPAGIEFIEGSILDMELMRKIFDDHAFDAVFHFAAIPQVQYCQEHPLEAFDVNVRGTHVILDQIARIRAEDASRSPKLVFSSSAAIYGNADKIPVEETDPKCPAGFYGLHKLQSESLIVQYAIHKGVDAVCLRYFNVFGPGQRGDSAYATVIAKWFSSIQIARDAASEPTVRIDGDGTQSRDFIYIDKVVEANLAAYEHGKSGEAYNVASGQEYSLLDLKGMIEKTIGKELSVDWRPPREGDIKRSLASTAKSAAEIQFDGRGDIERDIRETAAWWGF